MKWYRVTMPVCALLLSACFNTTPVRDPARRFIPCPDSSRNILPVAGVGAAGIRSVVLPAYLDSSKIAIRSGGTELVFSDINLWSEPLQTSVTRILAEGMRLRIGSAKVDVFPYKPGVMREVEIRVEFDRFEGDADGSIHVSGRYIVTKLLKDSATEVIPFDYKGTWTSGDYASLAKALGNAADDLAGDIVKRL